MNFKKSIAFLFIFILCFSVIGCGKKDKELQRYEEELDLFTNTLGELHNTMNQIDPTSESAIFELLSAFEEIEKQFIYLASLTAPAQFASANEFAKLASEYMTTSVSLYHEAYANNTYNEDIAKEALDYYKAAILKVNNIGQILAGEEVTQ